MSERSQQIARQSGYAAFLLFATLLFVYSTFPIEAMQGRINKELQKQMPAWSVSFERASPYRLTGLDVEDLALTIQQAETPTVVHIDRVKARLRLLPLLKKHYVLSYDLMLIDSHLTGTVGAGAETQSLALDAEDLDLGHLPNALYKLLGTRITGTGVVVIDLNLDSNDPKKSTGSGKLEIRRAGLGETSLWNIHPMMPGELSLPPVDLGNIDVAFEIKDGNVQFKKFSIKGADLELRVSGDIGLKKQIAYSSLNLAIEFKLSEDFVTKNPKFGILAVGKRTAEGFTSAKLAGTVQSPQPAL